MICSITGFSAYFQTADCFTNSFLNYFIYHLIKILKNINDDICTFGLYLEMHPTEFYMVAIGNTFIMYNYHFNGVSQKERRY